MKLTVAIVLFLSLTPVLAEGPAQQQAQVSETKQIDFAPGGIIHWNNSYGALYIEGWDRPQVEITVIKSTRYFEPAAKNKETLRLETIQVATERRSDKEIVISTTMPKRRNTNHVSTEYRINIPGDTRLVIDHHGGIVLVGNVTSDVDIANTHGDIMLMLPARLSYAIDARSKMGHVASDFTASGASTSPHLHLRTGFGGITILALP